MSTPSQPQPLQGKTEPEVTGLLAEKSSISPAQAKPADTNNAADVVKHHVTISPATTNRNLEFADDFKQVFPASSLRSAFENHDAFNAVFENHRDGRASYTDEFMSLLRGGQTPSKKKKKKFPGMIVATSEDEGFATAAGAEGKSGGTAAAAAAAVGAESTLTGASKGLVSTIMTAYNRHCDLVLSPDDVWLAILAQFCVYVNNHEEALRSRIVKHAGQKEIEVFSFGDLTTADYKGMIVDLLEEMRKKVKSPELADWFRPGFSTTTEKDEVCAAATAMASLQSYFSFTMHLGCGIPSVTMLGTVADWKLLREKVDRLLEFEVQGNLDGKVMEMWVGYLRKVCDGFVESAEHPDSAKTLEFWDKVLSHLRGMSGPSYITGWLSVFTCFDKDGTFIGDHIMEGSEFPLIKDETICHNVVSCPVKIDDNGVKTYDGTLFVGQVAFEAKQGGGEVYPTVRPRNDWCMAVAVKEGAAAKEGVCMV